MTCPSCGTIAAVGVERCARCGSALELPTNRPGAPIPVVRAPTNRGEIAQRAAGIVALPIGRPRPPQAVTPVPTQPGPSYPAPPQPAPAVAPPAVAPALGAPVGRPASYPPPAKAQEASPPLPGWAPPDATSVRPTMSAAPSAPPATGTQIQSGWAMQPPPPPAPEAAPPAGQLAPGVPAPTTQLPLVDPTTAFQAPVAPSPTPSPTRDARPATDTARTAEEAGDEPRGRTVRPGVDASWPPPPGPWSGRRTTEP